MAIGVQVLPHDLAWSFRPILHPLRILGIDLNVSNTPSIYRRCGFLLVGISTLTAIGYQAMEEIRGVNETSFNEEFMRFLRFSEAVVHSFLGGAVAFFMLLFRWRSLRGKLQEMQRFSGISTQCIRQNRNVFTLFTVAALIWVKMTLSNVKCMRLSYQLSNRELANR